MLKFIKKQEKEKGKKIKLEIEGMHCVSCAMNIDGELEELQGIFSSSTSYANSSTTVVYDPKKINESDLVNSIQKIGYKARLK